MKNLTGQSAQVLDLDFLREALPKRNENGHKGSFGKVMVVGGAVGYTGAPYLAATSAQQSGCGLVFLGVPEEIWAVEAVKCTAAMPFPLPGKDGGLALAALEPLWQRLKDCDVLALGPGLGRSKEAEQLVVELLMGWEKAVVLDADGINALSAHMDVLEHRRGRITILTPHEGEFARLTTDREDRVESSRRFAQRYGCYLVRKGPGTLIATPYGTVLENPTGNSGLAKGGSGDVLTGIIASLLAQGATATQSACLGVWLHGRGGDIAARRYTPYAMGVEDVIGALPEAFSELME